MLQQKEHNENIKSTMRYMIRSNSVDDKQQPQQQH